MLAKAADWKKISINGVADEIINAKRYADKTYWLDQAYHRLDGQNQIKIVLEDGTIHIWTQNPDSCVWQQTL